MTRAADPSPPAPPRERAREARRAAVLEGAEEIFAERGFGGATMAEIGSRAGYSAGNLYNVFENKEALFGEVVTSRATLLLDLTRNALASSGPLVDRLDRYLESICAFVEQHKGFFVVITQTHLDFDWHSGGEADGLRDAFDDDLLVAFRGAIDRGELPAADPEIYVSVFRGGINSHVARWVRGQRSAEELRSGGRQLAVMFRRLFALQR